MSTPYITRENLTTLARDTVGIESTSSEFEAILQDNIYWQNLGEPRKTLDESIELHGRYISGINLVKLTLEDCKEVVAWGLENVLLREETNEKRIETYLNLFRNPGDVKAEEGRYSLERLEDSISETSAHINEVSDVIQKLLFRETMGAHGENSSLVILQTILTFLGAHDYNLVFDSQYKEFRFTPSKVYDKFVEDRKKDKTIQLELNGDSTLTHLVDVIHSILDEELRTELYDRTDDHLQSIISSGNQTQNLTGTLNRTASYMEYASIAFYTLMEMRRLYHSGVYALHRAFGDTDETTNFTFQVPVEVPRRVATICNFDKEVLEEVYVKFVESNLFIDAGEGVRVVSATGVDATVEELELEGSLPYNVISTTLMAPHYIDPNDPYMTTFIAVVPEDSYEGFVRENVE